MNSISFADLFLKSGTNLILSFGATTAVKVGYAIASAVEQHFSHSMVKDFRNFGLICSILAVREYFPATKPFSNRELFTILIGDAAAAGVGCILYKCVDTSKRVNKFIVGVFVLISGIPCEFLTLGALTSYTYKPFVNTFFLAVNLWAWDTVNPYKEGGLMALRTITGLAPQ
jgi:hypothetical protein